MNIFLGTDHGGYELKELVKKHLMDAGHEVKDCGAHELDPDDDFTDYIAPVAREVAAAPSVRGIIFGRSGQGEAILANRFKGVRAVVYNTNNEEIIKLSREHNDSNVLSIGADFISTDEALKAIDLWLATETSTEEKYHRRNTKIDEIS